MSTEDVIKVRKHVYEAMGDCDMAGTQAMLWALLADVYGALLRIEPTLLPTVLDSMQESFNMVKKQVVDSTLR
jgi:hypothetical protein